MSAEQPLLENKPTCDNLRIQRIPTAKLDYQSISYSTCHESYLLTSTSLPIFLNILCEWIPELVSFIIIGHCIDSSTNLTIVALSYTFYTFVLFIVCGLLSGLYTLIQDVYENINNKYNYGTNINTQTQYYIKLYSQRAFIITLIISIPFVIMLSFGGTILVCLGININKSLQLNINFVCTQLIAMVYVELCRNITQRIIVSLPENSNTNTSQFFCNLSAALVSFPVSWYVIIHLDLGFKGFAIVITVCHTINFILSVILINCKHYGFIFKPLSLNQLLNKKGIITYLEISIPSMFMSLFEILTSYLVVLFCGFMDNAEVAVSIGIIMIIIARFLQFVFTAISYAVSIRISGYIYMGMMDKAKHTRNCGYLLTFILDLTLCFVLYLFKHQIISVFTSDVHVIDVCLTVMDILIIHSLMMSFEYLLSGISRGVDPSLATHVAPIILCAYYVISFPLMFVLIFAYGYKHSVYYGTVILFSLFALSKLISVLILQTVIWCKINWNIVDTKRCKNDLMQFNI